MTDENVVKLRAENNRQGAMEKIQEFAQAVSGFRDLFSAAIEKWSPALEWSALYLAASKPMKAAGIIPHRSAPWNQFDNSSVGEFPHTVLEHYSANWDCAESMFLEDIADHEVSDETKSAFKEALCCHRHGLYRASVLTLLPTIEREFRLAAGIGPGGQAASLEQLRLIIKNVPAGVVLRPVAPLYLIEILDQHLYEKVKTPDDIERLSKNPIPNRHAAIHGLVSYTSPLNSLNTIIMAEYVFFTISQITRQLKKQRYTECIR